MFQNLWKTLSDEISGPAAALAVADIARFHRIQASPGFRRAAELVYEKLKEAGLEAQILTFPADTSTSYWGSAGFQEWDAREASLQLIEPSEQAHRLADYREMPLSLVSRSLSFDGEAELVVLEQGNKPEEYENLDVRGKIVLARGNVQHVHEMAIQERGAVGLVFDGMAEVEHVRSAWEIPDAVQYTSFWYPGWTPQNGFGFAISQRKGERLRRLAREKTLRLQAHVDAHLYDGAFEVVEATIPGQTEEEIVLVAHLCHPQPSANDNASGAAALLEIARALSKLIGTSALTAPRRTLRFLWLPEMTGTFNYLSAHEDRIPRMVAGLNLDMVGQDQQQCGSSLLIEHPPHALSNFTSALLARLRENLLPEMEAHSGAGGYPLFRYSDIPFSGGSDHYIFSDPTVGVPMPMIIQWPDRYYHTSADTPDRVDPGMLAKVGCLSAAYAYWLAQAGAAEANWLARELSSGFRQDIIGIMQTAVTSCDEDESISRHSLEERVEYLGARHRDALESIQRVAQINVPQWHKPDLEFARQEWNRAADLIPQRPSQDPEPVEGGELIPTRIERGPIQAGAAVAQAGSEERAHIRDLEKRLGDPSHITPTLAVYWADGKRTVADIASLLRQETGQQTGELLAKYLQALAGLELIELE